MIKDETALEDVKKASTWRKTLKILSGAKTLSYSRPAEAVMGPEAVIFFDRACRTGTSVLGHGERPGFLHMYEMMTGSLAVRVLPNDSCYNYGCLLLRLFPIEKFDKTQTMTSVLRILANNPHLAAKMPKYDDTRKHKLSIVFKGSGPVQRLLEKCNAFLRSNENAIQWPPLCGVSDNGMGGAKPPEVQSVLNVPLKKCRKRDRAWLAPRVADFNQDARVYYPHDKRAGSTFVGMTNTDVASFADQPLSPLDLSAFVVFQERAKLVDVTQLYVSQHQDTKTHVAKEILKRFDDDSKHYASMENSTREAKVKTMLDAEVRQMNNGKPSLAVLQNLETKLRATLKSDFESVLAGLKTVIQMYNHVDISQGDENERCRRLAFSFRAV